MNLTLEHLRRVSVFLLLLSLNLRYLFVNVFYLDTEILVIFSVIFSLASLDYTSLTKQYIFIVAYVFVVMIIDYSFYKLMVLTILLVMQSTFFIDFKLFLKFTFIILGTTLLLLFLAYGKGEIVMSDGIEAIVQRDRYSFKMGHPNEAALYYFGLIISFLLLLSISRYKNFLWLGLFVSCLLAIYIATYTVSRSFIVASIVYILVLVYYNIRKFINKEYKIGFTRYLLLLMPILLTGLTLYFSIYVDDYPFINIALSYRPYLYNEFLGTIEFSNYIVGSAAFDDIIVDNSYLHLLFEAGIVVYIFFYWIYYYGMRNIINQQNIIVIATVISFLVYGLMETLLLNQVIITGYIFWTLIYKYKYQNIDDFDPANTEDEENSDLKELEITDRSE